MLYLWVKALHIIAIVCWFAGLFYLPRLFVYHAMAEDQPSSERFCIMERKLYRGIMNPSIVATLVLGAWLLYLNPAWLQMGWLHAKLAAVVALSALHGYLAGAVRRFAEDRNERPARHWRIITRPSST